MPSWPCARLSSGMQYAGPHEELDAYGEQFALHPQYVSGLTEGEGCFCVSFAIRAKLRTGLEARPSFSLSLNEKDWSCWRVCSASSVAAGSARPGRIAPSSTRCGRSPT